MPSQRVQIELDSRGPFCQHSIYVRDRPKEIRGINYPKSFRPFRPLFDPSELSDVESVLYAEGADVAKFWKPLFVHTPSSPLSFYVDVKLKVQRLKAEAEAFEPIDYKQTFDPTNRIGNGCTQSPRQWIPAREWFDPKIQNLQFSDIFSIFPEAEAKMLELILGRMGVGPSNHIPDGWDRPVLHTSRMAGIIVGRDPGTGKSTLMCGLSKAISKCGFKVKTFRSISERFGGGDYITADLALKDDMTEKTLCSLLSSEEAKTIITGGELLVEEKFVKAEQLRPKCVILANTNTWSDNYSYDVDPGIAARYKLISTYRMYEIFNPKIDLRPFANLPRIAAKLDCDEEALYLWAMRLATDRFWDLIAENQTNREINHLEQEVSYWTSRLRVKFKESATRNFAYALALSQFIRYPESPNLQEGTIKVITKALSDFYFVGVDPHAFHLHEKMKERWTNLRRPAEHYYMAFREMRWESVRKALTWYNSHNEDNATNSRSSSEILKDLIGKIHLRDGFKLSSGFSYFLDSWNSLLPIENELREEAKLLLESLSQVDLEKICQRTIVANDKWLIESDNYSPHIGHKIREKEYLRLTS
jgi:hypothetical protein